MIVQFRSPDSWNRLNGTATDFIRTRFPDLIKTEARLYPTTEFALLDVAFGLKSLFAFKKKFSFCKNQDPYIESTARAMASTGLAAQPFSLDLCSGVNIDAAKIQEIVDKDVAFVMYAETDPLLGRAWDCKKLTDALVAANSPRIRVSHLGLQGTPAVDRNTALILGLSSGGALALLGERLNFRSHFCPALPWDLSNEEFLKLLQQNFELQQNTSDDVPQFLKRLRPHFEPFFTYAATSVPDRIAIFTSEADGAALVEHLVTKSAEWKGRVTSASLSAWGGLKTMDWITHWGCDPKQVRGTIIVDRSIISDKFIKDLQQTFFHVLELQRGDQRSNQIISFDN